MKTQNDQGLKKRTWGNVEPGPLNEGEAAALRALKENAAKCSNVRPTNMDPEPGEGGTGHIYPERHEHWQMLSDDERRKAEERKNGHPKNVLPKA